MKSNSQSGFAILAVIVTLLIGGVTGAVIEHDKDVIKEESK